MQKLTRLLSSRLYKVEYDLYTETKFRLIEEFPSSANSNNNRYSAHFNSSGSGNVNNSSSGNNNNSITGVGTSNNSGRALSNVGGNPRVKVRSRHLSMQGNPRHGGSLKRGSSGRPLSACGSEGQLTDMKSQEKQYIEPQEQPIPEGSVSTILRNLSSASLSDIANTFKTDRKSTNLASSVVDEEGEEEGGRGGGRGEEDEGGHQEPESSKQNVKFGIKKNIISSASFSNTPSSSIHSSSNIQPSSTSISKRSNTNTSGNSLTGGGSGGSINGGNGGTSGSGTTGEKGVGRRAISIQQLDTLWQDSGSKLLNFVHHGDTNANPQISTSKIASRDEEKKGIIDWDHTSGSSIEETSTKVSEG